LRAVIFANGELRSPEFIKTWLQPDDVVIAADGGLAHCCRLSIVPAVVIGDLDSASPIDLAWARKHGATVLQYPPAKDEPDLELCLNWAMAQGCGSLRIVGGLGGRSDHAMANILLLMAQLYQGLDLRLDDGVEEVWLVHNQTTVHGNIGDLFSLLPFGSKDVKGVTTSGLKYPLNDETLCLGRSRGVSNILTAEIGTVSLASGWLLCIHTRIPHGGAHA